MVYEQTSPDLADIFARFNLFYRKYYRFKLTIFDFQPRTITLGKSIKKLASL